MLHDLELKHQKNGFESDILVKDEDLRRLRVRILLLRDENTALRVQVDLNNSGNTKLVAQCDDLKAQIEAKMAMIRSQEEQLRKQEREYSNLDVSVREMPMQSSEHGVRIWPRISIGLTLLRRPSSNP